MRAYKIERTTAQWNSILESVYGRTWDEHNHTAAFAEDVAQMLAHDNNHHHGQDIQLPDGIEKA